MPPYFAYALRHFRGRTLMPSPATHHTTRPGGADRERHQGRVKTRGGRSINIEAQQKSCIKLTNVHPAVHLYSHHVPTI